MIQKSNNNERKDEINQAIDARKEDAFYNFDTSNIDEISLSSTDEKDFVQALPDDASIHKVGQKTSGGYFILTAVQNGSLSTIVVPQYNP
jgi:hypothetical protein